MAVCNVEELLDANPCLVELSADMLDAVETQMICNLRNNLIDGAAITCDIEELISEAGCFVGVDPHRRKAIRAQLLCEILNTLA